MARLSLSVVTHASVGLPFPPSLVAADLAVDPDDITFSQRQLSHVPRRKVVPGHRRADHPWREHCANRNNVTFCHCGMLPSREELTCCDIISLATLRGANEMDGASAEGASVGAAGGEKKRKT